MGSDSPMAASGEIYRRLSVLLNNISTWTDALLHNTFGAINALHIEDLLVIKASIQALDHDLAALDYHNLHALSSAAHALRSPISGVVGFSQSMLVYPDLYDGAVLNASQRGLLQQIHATGLVLFNTINNLVDYAKIQLNTLELQFAAYGIDSVLKRLVSLAQELSHQTPLSIKAELPDYAMEGYGDEFRVLQALANIVTNAIEYAHEGTITVRAGKHAAHAEILIIDTGRGLPLSEQSRLFEPFHVSHAQPHNLGLGLYVAQNLLERQHAAFHLTSQPGTGTTVQVNLPLAHP